MASPGWIVEFLLPVFVCVVLPCVIVWITIKEKIFGRLTTGCILAALGIALFGVALFGKEAVTDSFYVPLGGGILLLLGIAFIVTYFIGVAPWLDVLRTSSTLHHGR